ncbi:MAG: hypothetical protein J6I49_01560 [Bacteroidales bacterium]|nr:hypothetical protein [Bacteroidales bacterium]
MKKQTLTLSLGLLLSSTIFAQNVNLVTENGKLTEAEQEEITERIKVKIEDFVRYQGDLATKSPELTPAVKNASKQKALDLFVEKGDPYWEMNPITGKKERLNSGVKMWIIPSKKFPEVKKWKLMKGNAKSVGYLDGLIRRSQRSDGYKQIVIEQADAVRVDTFREVAPNKFEAVAYVVQHFCGYSSDGFVRYEDYTLKRIKIYIERKAEITPDGNAVMVYYILLGDIQSDDIW